METAWNPKRPTSGHFHSWLVADLSEADGNEGSGPSTQPCGAPASS